MNFLHFTKATTAIYSPFRDKEDKVLTNPGPNQQQKKVTCGKLLGRKASLSSFVPLVFLAHLLAVIQEEDYRGKEKFGRQVLVQRSQNNYEIVNMGSREECFYSFLKRK